MALLVAAAAVWCYSHNTYSANIIQYNIGVTLYNVILPNIILYNVSVIPYNTVTLTSRNSSIQLPCAHMITVLQVFIFENCQYNQQSFKFTAIVWYQYSQNANYTIFTNLH